METHSNTQLNTAPEDDQQNGQKRYKTWTSLLKDLKRKYSAVFNRTCLNND